MTPSSAFLAAFSLHPAGVAVITANDPNGNPVGFTATSLASFSADPPRASFNIAQHASSYSAISSGARVLLHFLAGNQVDVARIMAGPADHRFDGDHWAADDRGLPRLVGVRAVLEAHVVAVTEVGANASVVVEIDGGDTHIECAPLVYVERRYHAVGDVVD
ncbi:MAG: flavin reductase family protein [Microbacteriaceae bacterium]